MTRNIQKLIKGAVTGSVVTAIMLFSVQSHAAKIVVEIDNVKGDQGSIGCALFNSKAGFPGDTSSAETQFSALSGESSVSCVFDNVEAGTYAVSVTHDKNDNGVTDKNFMGIPKEPWGVSNNIRKKMRAPRFSESSITVPVESAEVVVSITIR